MASSPPEIVSRALAHRVKQTVGDQSLTPASVLLLLYPKNGEYCILLNKRSEQVEHHKGEISFPGGARDPEDRVFKEIIEKRSIVPEVEPREGDCVIFDGAQLHGVLAERRVHTLFYVGFAANMCVPHRDYGMRAMSKRGYDVVLIEDCTTAVEVADTVEGMALTKAAILDVEVSGGYTVSSGDLLVAGEGCA